MTKETAMAIQDFVTHLPPQRLCLPAPAGPRFAPLFTFGLLTLACSLASFAFACATPFAAFAVIAAAMLPLTSALLVVAAAFAVNQAIGFGALHYPVDANTMLWGAAIGAAALAATVVASATLRLTRHTRAAVALGWALVAAYAIYELVLFSATPFLGGESAFTVAIIGWIGELNILWLIGLAASCEIARLLNRSSGDQGSHAGWYVA
jgi:hypothetical protein